MATIATAILPGRRMSHGRLLLEDWEIGCSMPLPLAPSLSWAVCVMLAER